MGQRYCLDTDFVISLIKKEDMVYEILKQIKGFPIFISTVTLFELFLRESNFNVIMDFKNQVSVLDFNEAASIEAASIFKLLKKKGKLMDYRDLFIASTVITNNCTLVTFNKKHFENIPHLELL